MGPTSARLPALHLIAFVPAPAGSGCPPPTTVATGYIRIGLNTFFTRPPGAVPGSATASGSSPALLYTNPASGSAPLPTVVAGSTGGNLAGAAATTTTPQAAVVRASTAADFPVGPPSSGSGSGPAWAGVAAGGGLAGAGGALLWRRRRGRPLGGN